MGSSRPQSPQPITALPLPAHRAFNQLPRSLFPPSESSANRCAPSLLASTVDPPLFPPTLKPRPLLVLPTEPSTNHSAPSHPAHRALNQSPRSFSSRLRCSPASFPSHRGRCTFATKTSDIEVKVLNNKLIVFLWHGC